MESRSEGTRDLYDVATWEPRTALDRLAERVHAGVISAARFVVLLLAVLILVAEIATGVVGATLTDQPMVVGLVVLSIVPALGLAVYVYTTDVTTSEPLVLLVGTFVLAVLFAGFAAVVNTLLSPVTVVPFVGTLAFFYLVVGPIEETVKLLAIRLYAFRDDRFDAVIDGAVYGAVAGLGFATIENALYISQSVDQAAAARVLALPLAQVDVPRIVDLGSQVTAVRALAGPGHVIYSAFAGYYLGLAKFNPERAGPIVVKGLLIAAFIHGTYNVLVGIVPGIAVALTGANTVVVLFGFVLAYDGLFGYVLYRKLDRYRRTYAAVSGEADRDIEPERTEFDA